MSARNRLSSRPSSVNRPSSISLVCLLTSSSSLGVPQPIVRRLSFPSIFPRLSFSSIVHRLSGSPSQLFTVAHRHCRCHLAVSPFIIVIYLSPRLLFVMSESTKNRSLYHIAPLTEKNLTSWMFCMQHTLQDRGFWKCDSAYTKVESLQRSGISGGRARTREEDIYMIRRECLVLYHKYRRFADESLFGEGQM